MYKVEPVKDENKISFFLPIKYSEKLHDSKPGDYLSHCIGHEGEGSLLSALIWDNLAVALTSYQDHMLNSLSYLMITITLTDKGLNEYQNVIKKVFAYLKMMKIEGPSDDAFNEMNDQKKLSWTFIEKSKAFSFVTWFAEWMTLFDDTNIHKILSSMYLFDKFDKEMIKSIIDEIDITKSLILLYTKNHTT